MYYKGHSVKLAIAKYEETGYVKALLVTEDNDVVEEISINPIGIVSDINHKDRSSSIKPRYVIFKERFYNLLEFKKTFYIRNVCEILRGNEVLQVKSI